MISAARARAIQIAWRRGKPLPPEDDVEFFRILTPDPSMGAVDFEPKRLEALAWLKERNRT
jgi:hypothetical protein